MRKLILFLHSIKPMSAPLEKHLLSIIRKKVYKKGQIILNIGERCNEINFIDQGYIRSYYHKRNKKVTDYFMMEGDVFVGVISFFRGIPSREILIAGDYCEFYGISKAELEETCRLYPEFKDHYLYLTGEYYCRAMERGNMPKLENAAQKFELFINIYPSLIGRASNTDIASFLGIAVSTYKTAKKNYFNKKKHL